NEEGVGAGAAGESGGLGIEEGPPGGMGAGHGSGGQRVEQVVGEFGEIGDIDAAMPAVALPKLFGFEVLSQGRGDHFAGEEFLDEFRVGSQRWTRWWGCVRVLAVHARDALAKGGELLL